MADWISPEIPPTQPKGTDRYYIVAVRRVHSGKVYTFPACYLNAYALEYEDCICQSEDWHPEEGCPTTGWFSASSEGEYDYNYSALLSPGDEFIAWCEIERHPLDHRNALSTAESGK